MTNSNKKKRYYKSISELLARTDERKIPTLQLIVESQEKRKEGCGEIENESPTKKKSGKNKQSKG